MHAYSILIASTWFCNVHASFIGHVVGRICQCRLILPRKRIISLIPITDLIKGALPRKADQARGMNTMGILVLLKT